MGYAARALVRRDSSALASTYFVGRSLARMEISCMIYKGNV